MDEQIQVCTYDNPITMWREAWRNGHMIEGFSFALLFLADGCPFPNGWPWKLGGYEWEPGFVWGEPFALLTDEEILVMWEK